MADSAYFATTRWTLVREAARGGDALAVEALGTLVLAYWQPLYRYARRKGKSPEDSTDLVQGFFTHVVKASALRGTDHAKGRFRAFLLASFQHWMILRRKENTRTMTAHPSPSCPDCDEALPPDSPHSLCPACLMRQALASRTVARDGDKTSHLPPPSPEEIAGKFPGYEILECLGRGGMGVVYKARQKSLDRWVAIKVLAPERVHDERFAGHFGREAKTLARISHPNIVTVFDHGDVRRPQELACLFLLSLPR